MSGKKHARPESPLAEWTVTLHGEAVHHVPRSRMRRDEHGGYAFTDESGPVADFPPGTVASARRKPQPVEVPDPGDAE